MRSNKFYDTSKKIKTAERRLDTLNNHFMHYDNYKKHKSFHDDYKKLKGRKAEVFYDKHHEKILSYEAAKNYLDGVMNGRTTIPIKTWQAEYEQLTADKFALCEDFYKLKDETHYVELLRRSTENLMREGGHNSQITRAKGIKI